MSAIIATSTRGPMIRNAASCGVPSTDFMALRAFLVWCLILVLEFAHGVARTVWLVPLVGDLPARQIGVGVGSALILLVAWLTARWIGARTRRERLAIGFGWAVLMLGAEAAIGRWLFGYPWSRILEDFDLSRGGLLGLGIVVLAAAPSLTSHRGRGG